MNLEWIAEDATNTIGHVSKLKLDGITSYSPIHALTTHDFDMAKKVGVITDVGSINIVLAGFSPRAIDWNNR